MRIEVYGRPLCDACEYACDILDSNGAPYQYYNVETLTGDELTYLMTVRAPRIRELPIVFVEGRKLNEVRELNEIFKNRTRSQMGEGEIRKEGWDAEGDGGNNQPYLSSGKPLAKDEV